MKPLQILSSSSILIAEKQSSGRKLLSDTFRALGYENVQVVDTLSTVLTYLEAKPNSWIICSLDLDAEVNALQVLKLITTEVAFYQSRLSLLMDESDLELASAAFALGASSWHLKDYRPDPIKETLKIFIDSWNNPKADEAKITASYLHSALAKLDIRPEILALYSELVSVFPQDPSYVLKLASAQFDSSLPSEGEKSIALAKLMEADGWQALADKYLPKGTDLKGKIDIGKVAVIEPDLSVHKLLQVKFAEFTNSQVHYFSDGIEAWNSLSKDESFGMIFMEWKIPSLSGPALIQRLRSGNHKFTPVVLLSTKLQKSDLNLLSEMGVGDVLPKPIESKEFLSTLISMHGEIKNPQLFRNLELNMLKNIVDGKLDRAEISLQKIWANPNFSDGLKYYAAGRFSYQRKQFSESCERARLSFTKGGDQLKSIHLLGQSLMRLDDYQGAVKCFRKAQELSPKNLERLCAICEAEEYLKNESSSEQALGEAAKLDQGHNTVVSLETKNALNDGNIALAQDLFKHAGDVGHLVAELNNCGVAYIRTGSFAEGIQFYERTLQAIPESGNEWRLKVSYNLALAYARQNKLDAALDLLSNLTLDLDLPVVAKIKNLSDRLKSTSKEGNPFALVENESLKPNSTVDSPHSPWESSQKTSQFEGPLKSQNVGPFHAGDRGCYLIYKCPSGLQAKVTILTKVVPQIKSVPIAS